MWMGQKIRSVGFMRSSKLRDGYGKSFISLCFKYLFTGLIQEYDIQDEIIAWISFMTVQVHIADAIDR